MSQPPRILAFSGSLRAASWNHRIAELAARAAAEAGADVTVLRLRDYPLPVYDQEIEEATGIPDNALALKKLFREHQGLLIASPEYNGSVTAALKNVIDWASRPEDGYPRLAEFKGKVAGLLACSPGSLGGLRGLSQLRAILSGIGTIVLPNQVAVPGIHDRFTDTHVMDDDKIQSAVEQVGQRVAQVAAALHP
ncbi:MAG: NAD(P)H-dependent oxidoreductase [Phycisphaerales bacterium]|nr:NAD(P)H-dependent oxidoreductase [Phycisphaerales bacterium]